MAQIPKGRLVKGPYKLRCWDCAIYFSTTVLCSELLAPYGACHLARLWFSKSEDDQVNEMCHMCPFLKGFLPKFYHKKNMTFQQR